REGEPEHGTRAVSARHDRAEPRSDSRRRESARSVSAARAERREICRSENRAPRIEINGQVRPVSIADRLTAVRTRIRDAALAAGRDPSSVRLVAVSKTFPIDAVREAYAAGQRDFGENRVQEALQKISALTDLEIRWHLLGHLQTNKARKAAPVFSAIH